MAKEDKKAAKKAKKDEEGKSKKKKDKVEKAAKKEKKDKGDKKEKKSKKRKKDDFFADDEPAVAKEEGEKKKARHDPERQKRRAEERKEELATAAPDAFRTPEEEAGRPRTRSLSFAEEKKVVAQDPEEFRKEHEIKIFCESESDYTIPEPFGTFAQTPFCKPIRSALEGAGFIKPSPIQAAAWPICLEGRDIISVAKTGSGKTCGFLLPAYHALQTLKQDGSYNREGKPSILVMAPTRELACQINDEAKKFGRCVGINAVCLYGGAPKRAQIGELRRYKPEIIIATPGRLNDMLNIKCVYVDQVKFLVLDEADRMLDMGFEPQIRSVIEYLNKPKDNVPAYQTMMFSATWPREVRYLASEFLNKPVQVNIGDSNTLNANKSIKQEIMVIDESQKEAELAKLLSRLIDESPDKEKHTKIIIFSSLKRTCHELGNALWKAGKKVDTLHGDRQQWERTQVMNKFKTGELRILVATDVAARGLDVKDVEVVINYDFPLGKSGVEDYVHRIGRTGRAGKSGLAYTFFTRKDSKSAYQLIQILTKSEQVVPPELQSMGGRRSYGGGGWGKGKGKGKGRSYGKGGGKGKGKGKGKGGGKGKGKGKGGFSGTRTTFS